jgi:transposase
MLSLAEDLGANWLLDLWEVMPTPDKAVRVRETTVARAQESPYPPFRCRPCTERAAQAGPKLDRLCKELAEPVADDENSKAAGQRVEHDDVTILSSLPGVGRIILTTLLAAASDALQRRDYHALRNLCGAAPVTRQSGKSRMVLRRRACNRRLSNALSN